MRNKQKDELKQHQLYLVRPSVWKKLKADNTIDPEFMDKAKMIEALSKSSYPLQLLQKLLYDKKIRKTKLHHSPIFILGLWRSGTTHLHYALARDEQFGTLINYQAFVFNVAFLSKTVLRKISRFFIPETRPQDNVQLTPEEPAEEEQPFSTMSPYAGIHSFFFPRNTEYFKKYNLFNGISEKEKRGWKKDYLYLLKSIACFDGRSRLLLKNPHSTGRIKELLELFPDAKFIFIHRDPYTVFQSTLHMYEKITQTQYLQNISAEELENSLLENNRDTLLKYRNEKQLIPQGNLVEIPFSELDKKPLQTIESIYKNLKLPGYDSAKPAIKTYLSSVKNYKKNKFPEPSPHLKQKLESELNFFFEDYHYKKRK